MSISTPKPEILAPAASWEMIYAAVHNGADAVYMGMPYFNARGRTTDYTPDEIKAMIDFCHLYGVKVFLACNVLIFEQELSQIEELFREILPLRPDALIVQDLGLVRLIKKLAPEQVVHASTQMTVSNNEAIDLTEDLDIKRYVLAREVSMKEMAKIREATQKELEVFVHGALCVSYSGQCLTSESHGGRSANRGQCAQSCRLPYELIVDGKVKDLGSKKHLVSPQDLCGLEDVPELTRMGIESFKIEGRYKSPEYVASTVRNYKEVSLQTIEQLTPKSLRERFRELGLTFARGHFNGWLDGVNHQQLVDARFSRPQGNFVGEVVAVNDHWVDIQTQYFLEIGDGVVIHDFDNDIEVGGILFSIQPGRAGTLSVKLDREVDTRALRPGMEVFHNSSSSLDKKLRSTFNDKAKHKKISLTGILTGNVGEVLTFTVTDDTGNTVTTTSQALLAPARSAPLTKESAEAELGALSATPFLLTALSFKVQGLGFIHTKELKELRRAITTLLTEKRTSPPVPPLTSAEEMNSWKNSAYKTTTIVQEDRATLNVLIRDESQLEALSGEKIGWVYLDYEFNKDYEVSLTRVRELGFKCAIATTRILKPGELGHLKYIERLKPDAILVRNLGALQYLKNKEIPLIGDFSLNVSNGLTAQYLMDKGLSRLTSSYDLNQEQLVDMLRAAPSIPFEVTVHQYMPAFHMEHCVYAAFLSTGTSFKDCGRPCEKHRVELKDPDGTIHPLKPDAECRNTMFQGKPQSAARLIPELKTLGVKNYRLEALFESPAELRAKIRAYGEVIEGTSSTNSAFEKLGIVERYGITEGQLFNFNKYQDKKKMGNLRVVN
jgi:putative protease